MCVFWAMSTPRLECMSFGPCHVTCTPRLECVSAPRLDLAHAAPQADPGVQHVGGRFNVMQYLPAKLPAFLCQMLWYCWRGRQEPHWRLGHLARHACTHVRRPCTHAFQRPTPVSRLCMRVGRVTMHEHVEEGISRFAIAMETMFTGGHVGKLLVRVHAEPAVGSVGKA